MWSVMLVLDARIAVAEECVRAVTDSGRARRLGRILGSLQGVRAGIESCERSTGNADAVWGYLSVVRDCASDVAWALRCLSGEDALHYDKAQRQVAQRSCETILAEVVPSFADVERAASHRSPAWDDLLRLHADVVDLNWTLSL
jgi:hypothetical protein